MGAKCCRRKPSDNENLDRGLLNDDKEKKTQKDKTIGSKNDDKKDDEIKDDKKDNAKAIPNKLMRTQSPINLSTHKPILLTRDEMLQSSFKIRYPAKIDGCRIINNGYTVQVNIPDNIECNIVIKDNTYTLKQFHFHCPSEHTVNNDSLSMEMHLVHLNKDNEIAVIGFIFDINAKKSLKPKFRLSKSKHHLLLQPNESSSKKVKSDLNVISEDANSDDNDDDFSTDEDMADDDTDDENANNFLKQFFDQLVYKKTEDKDDIKNGGILLKRKISFDYLFETSSDNISKRVDNNEIEIDLDLWEYMGSLTTPPYTEGVHWYVIKKIQNMSKGQLTELKKCWDRISNARVVQKLNGRIIKTRSGVSIL